MQSIMSELSQHSEQPLTGWKMISADVGLSVQTVWRMARRNRDPLPVWKYLHTVIAWPSALRDWKLRQMIPARAAGCFKPFPDEPKD
jgi:hypothetical protein